MQIPQWLYSHGSAVLMQIPLSKEEQQIGGYLVRLAAMSDFSAMAQCRMMKDPNKGIALFKNRMLHGMLCHVLCDEVGTVLGFAWVSLTENLLEDASRYVINIGVTSIYLFDTYLHPSSRAKGLYKLLVGSIQKYWKERGRINTYVIVDSSNERSLRAHMKLQASVCERVSYTCLLGLDMHTIGQKKPQVQFGWLGSKKVVSSLYLSGHATENVYLETLELDDDSQWEAVLDELQAFDAQEDRDEHPLLTSTAMYIWWKNDIKGRYSAVLLCIREKDSNTLIAYGVFRKFVDTQRLLKPRVLEAFQDLYFMDNRVMVRKADVSARFVLQFMSRHRTRRLVQKQTGTDMIVWRHLTKSELSLHPWTTIANALVEYPMLELTQYRNLAGNEQYSHALKDIRKMAKRIKKATESDPVVSHYCIDASDTAQLNTLSKRLLALMQQSWQHTWMRDQGNVDLPLYERKLLQYLQAYSASGSLHIHMLEIDKRDAAYLVSVWDTLACRCLLIGYDAIYKAYSPGKTVFASLLRDCVEENLQCMHLGGSLVGWKEEWMTHLSHLDSLELWLDSSIGIVHRLKAWVRNK